MFLLLLACDNIIIIYLGKPQKSNFYSGRTTKRGRETLPGKAGTLRIKNFPEARKKIRKKCDHQAGGGGRDLEVGPLKKTLRLP